MNFGAEQGAPETSVILAAYNACLYTQQCIASLRRHLAGESYEIIVIDNGSTDGTHEWLSGQQDVRLVRNGENRGLAHAWNQGMKMARGKTFLFLHNDVLLPQNAFRRLHEILWSRADIGAVGPCTKRCFYHSQQGVIGLPEYSDIHGLQLAADVMDQRRWPLKPRLFLEGFCFMVKRSAAEATGEFDEGFAYAGYEDVDFTLRLHGAGYAVLQVGVYVHHGTGSFAVNDIPWNAVVKQNRAVFYKKWNVYPDYSMMVREELLEYIDAARAELCVLDVGCACGTNLMWLKYYAPDAELYGIELNPVTSRMAKEFGHVCAEDVENIDRPEWKEKFDYIIMADILEHLRDPWETLRRMAGFLKPGGKAIMSVPNVNHISNLWNMLQGDWEYQDAGILDRTHLRFFTRKSFTACLEKAGFQLKIVKPRLIVQTKQQERFMEVLCSLKDVAVDREELSALQWIFVAEKKEGTVS